MRTPSASAWRSCISCGVNNCACVDLIVVFAVSGNIVINGGKNDHAVGLVVRVQRDGGDVLSFAEVENDLKRSFDSSVYAVGVSEAFVFKANKACIGIRGSTGSGVAVCEECEFCFVVCYFDVADFNGDSLFSSACIECKARNCHNCNEHDRHEFGELVHSGLLCFFVFIFLFF